ncbi:patatin-like phospholipase family protein [Hydrogenophaga sp. MI9]|uniref:patatin-like phospholipase family protein n=1 Tax=Hydrogenophaga sp. MI9 TaxID=3453719 RepID=UPI003EE9FD21
MRIVLDHRKWILVSGLVAVLLSGCSLLPTQGGSPPGPPPVVEVPQRPPRLGLALGGGAARGFAHVGVIQVLEANGIRPDVVAGTSAGSLVAALYASGKSAAELERVALGMDEATLTDWVMPLGSRGLMRGEALARYVRQAVGGKLIEQMKLPLGILATDLGNGQGVLFRRGDAAQAVRASSAVPGVFNPVTIAGHDYVDGGLVAPVPVHQAREMGAEVVLAVDISADPQDIAADGLLTLLPKTTAIMGQSINRLELARADVVVRPSLAGVGSADFTARQRSIDAGRAAMLAALPRLKAALAHTRAIEPH